MKYWLKWLTPGVMTAGLLIAVTAGTVGGQEDGTNPFADDDTAIAEGKTIFEAVCAGSCHVTAGGERDGKCPNLFDCEWKNDPTAEELFRIVSEGVPQTEMVGFKGKLPDDMLWKIIAYVRSASPCD